MSLHPDVVLEARLSAELGKLTPRAATLLQAALRDECIPLPLTRAQRLLDRVAVVAARVSAPTPAPALEAFLTLMRTAGQASQRAACESSAQVLDAALLRGAALVALNAAVGISQASVHYARTTLGTGPANPYMLDD